MNGVALFIVGGLALVFAVIITVFLIRWVFKIDEIVEQLEAINNKLSK